jgi:bifunctional ADP-heptose synthase (sugar kinase/adenylyltransferase)
MLKVLIIGETCVDRFIYCKSNRLSPEAPVPVLIPVSIKTNEGMAGNTVANVESLLPDVNIVRLHQSSKITKTRYVDKKSNHMFFRFDEGEESFFTYNDFSIPYNDIFNDTDIVIVSDYNKGFLNDKDLIEIGKKSTLSILDSKRKLSKEIINAFTFVKLNESERKDNNEIFGNNIITTLGKKGAEYQNTRYPSYKPQDTIDVSGAGDTFTAAFIIKYYETRNIGESIEYANRKSSEVVARPGVVVPINNF